MALAALLLGVGSAGVGPHRPGTPAHHRAHGFANLDPDAVPASAWGRWRFFVRRAFATTFRPQMPAEPLPQVPNDGVALQANHTAPTVTWVGHSTLLVQLDGVNLLTDPQWSDRASPLSFAGPRRLAPPGLAFTDLPPIQLVVISHDHYDHLDEATVRRLDAVHHPLFLVPLGLKAWFAGLGIDHVEEFDWWQERVVDGLIVTCVPAQHFSGRAPWDRNRRLWSGWAVRGRARRFYFAGDSGYWEGFREIGERLGPFDLAAIPIGAYLPPAIMHFYHTTPAEALRALDDVGGRHLVPIHWGTFDLAEEPPADPAARLRAEAHRRGLPPDRVWILALGETRRW